MKAGELIAVSDYSKVVISGLSQVQAYIDSTATKPEKDPYFKTALWVEAIVLGALEQWEALIACKIPSGTNGFDAAGVHKSWPMRLTNAHWIAVLPALTDGEYAFRCPTIDEK